MISLPDDLQLGASSIIPANPKKARLDRVPNPPDAHYVTRFTAPEFTSLCPVTGQPDFAHIVIDFVPSRWLVESKSLNFTSPRSATTAHFTRIAPWRSGVG